MFIYWRNGFILFNYNGFYLFYVYVYNIWDVLFYENRNLLFVLFVEKFRINMLVNLIFYGDFWIIGGIFYIFRSLGCKENYIVII